MKLEAAIQQTRPFNSQIEKALVNLLYSHNYITNMMSAFFREYGLTAKQYNILRILRGAGEPISTATIRDRMIDRMSDASRIVDRLEKKDLILKKSCPSDKRKVDVEISIRGKELLESIEDPMADHQKSMIGLNEAEAKTLNILLDKLRIT